jgi:hypothetical protein
MALVKCRECGREISDQATACPHCGVPLAAPGVRNATRVEVVERRSGCGTLLVIGLVVLVFAYAVNQCRGPERAAASDDTLPAPASPPSAWNEVATQGVFHFIETRDESADALRLIVAQVCGTQAMCRVGIWPTGAAPRALPMSDAALATRLAQYGRNTTTGANEWTWSCRVNPDDCSR